MQVLTSEATAEWYTPPELIEPIREFFGGKIDLDPASNPQAQGRVLAANWFGPEQSNQLRRDGLALPWFGKVFLNPPYQGKTSLWVEKARNEYYHGCALEIILLVKSVPGYVWWEKLWCERPVCMLRRRPRFINENGVQNGEAKQGHCLAYFGPLERWQSFERQFENLGRIVIP